MNAALEQMLKAYESQNVYYIFRHETGHVLGMGHVALGAQNSIMAPSYVNNCYGVKIYDINVLEGFYPNP